MHDSRFIGCIRVSPPLNEHEMAFLRDLSEAGRTLRSTPTGRGNSDVPFARLAWEVCDDGCCLSWDHDVEATRWMAPSLTFLIDHLFRAGGEGEGRRQLQEFTFDHVLGGVVVGRGDRDADTTLIEVVDNAVSGGLVPTRCSATKEKSPTKRPARRGSNVIEFRPRRA